MSTAIPFRSLDPPGLPFHRFSVDQYHRLGELGVLTPEDRVELLEGWIVKKMNQRPSHGFVVGFLTDWFIVQVIPGWIGRCQLPITLQFSEPEPDFAVVRGIHADYRQRHPDGHDCRLLIEVADTSLLKDRAKASIYAAAGIEEYWIINLVDRQLECMTQLDSTGYRQTGIFKPSETMVTQIGDRTLSLTLTELFGP